MTAKQKSLHDLIVEIIAIRDIRLPIFNPVALRLQQALHRDDSKIADIEAMIIEDQALASQILRVANAAFYQGLQAITTIRKAIIRLGIQQVANLAMVVAQQQLYQTISGAFSSYQEQLWRHAFASALGCKWLAERCGYRSEAETAFLAGLLHNIGQLALLKIIEDLRISGAVTGNLPETLIIEILDSTMHTEQGHLLATKWNLPDPYCIVVRDHHQEPCDPNNILLLLVRLVDQACAKIGIGLHSDPQVALAATPEAQALNLGEITLAELEILLEDSIATANQV
ncbi:MAG: HDOD domain-containing protein [Candidatus Competibacteraceae bacterium]